MEEGSIRPVRVTCGRAQGTSPAELVVPEEDPVPEEEAGPALAAATEACGQSRAGRWSGAGRSSRACATDTATLEDHAEDAQKRAKGFQNGKEEYIGKTKRNGILASQHTGESEDAAPGPIGRDAHEEEVEPAEEGTALCGARSGGQIKSRARHRRARTSRMVGMEGWKEIKICE